jgi:hypothetical protein
MILPNPETNKSENEAANEKARRNEQYGQGARKTASLCGNKTPRNSSDPGDKHSYAQEQYPKTKLVLQIVMTVATVGAFAAATFYACYARKQTRAMNKSLTETRNLAVRAAEANTIARQAVKDANQRAKDANQIARDDLTSTERPWVSVAKVAIAKYFAHEQPMQVTVLFQNSGKSPALHETAQGILKPYIIYEGGQELTKRDLPECWEPKPEWNDNGPGAFIVPGNVLTTLRPISSPVLSDPAIKSFDSVPGQPLKDFGAVPEYSEELIKAPPQELKLVDVPGKSGFALYFVGCIDYFDEFHGAHRTRFCNWYVGTGSPSQGQFGTCSFGNSAD